MYHREKPKIKLVHWLCLLRSQSVALELNCCCIRRTNIMFIVTPPTIRTNLRKPERREFPHFCRYELHVSLVPYGTDPPVRSKFLHSGSGRSPLRPFHGFVLHVNSFLVQTMWTLCKEGVFAAWIGTSKTETHCSRCLSLSRCTLSNVSEEPFSQTCRRGGSPSRGSIRHLIGP